MAGITDPEGEQRSVKWAKEQTDVIQLIHAYKRWYSWADANEWVAGNALLEQIGACAAGNAEAIKFLQGEVSKHNGSRSKADAYLRQAAMSALFAAKQGNP